jgi:hypothetical protein
MSTRRGILAMLGLGPVAIASMEPQGIPGIPYGGTAIPPAYAGEVVGVSNGVNVRATLSAAYRAGLVNRETMLAAIRDWDNGGSPLNDFGMDDDIKALRSFSEVAKRRLQKDRSEERAMHRWTRADDGFAMSLAKKFAGIAT